MKGVFSCGCTPSSFSVLKVDRILRMVKKRMKKARNLILLVGFVLCWCAVAESDEWERMHIRKFEPRRDPPKVSLQNLNGKKIALEDYKGKVIFLNFWTTWCGYCKREMPSMEKLYQKFKDKGFIVLAIDVRESAGKVKSFWERYDLTFPAVLDPTGMAAMAFGVRGYPGSFFIDRDGKVVGGAPGAREWFSEDAQSIVAKLLNEGGPKEKEQRTEATSDEAGGSEVSTEENKEKTDEVSFDLSSITGPPVRSQGDTLVKSMQVFDLDGGAFGDEKTADLSWSEIGFSTRYLIPQNGAEFAHKGTIDQVTFDDIILSKYSGSPINGSAGDKNNLKPGTIIYVRTNEGRFACFRILGNDGALTFSWITYEKD